MYFVLFGGVILLLFLSYKLFDRDIMQPAVFLCLFFFGAIALSFYLYNYWHLYDYDKLTTTIFLTGIISFIVGSYIARISRIRITFGRLRDTTEDVINGRIIINDAIILFSIVLSLVTLLLFLRYYRTKINTKSIFSSIVDYKASKTDDESSMPGYLNILIKTLHSFSCCFAYTLINNTICKEKSAKDVLLIVPALFYCIISLLSANRGNVLILVMGCVAAWYILYHRIRGWNIRITRLFFIKGVKITIIALVLFWGFTVIVRNKTVTNMKDSFLTYICAYISGPLASLDMYIKQGGKTCEWWGQETFVALNNNLYSLFKISHVSTRFLEFRSGFGHSVVNIYSSFRRFYHDFGMPGVLLLSSLQGYITSKMYYWVRRKKYYHSIDLPMILYCFFFYTVPYTLTDEFFYSSNVSISGLVKLFILFGAFYMTFSTATQNDTRVI